MVYNKNNNNMCWIGINSIVIAAMEWRELINIAENLVRYKISNTAHSSVLCEHV